MSSTLAISLVLAGAFASAIGSCFLALNAVRQSQRIAALNEQIAGSVTGGDSFCYLMPQFAYDRLNTLNFYLTHNGDYPVFDLSVTIFDETGAGRVDPGALFEKYFGYRQRTVTHEEWESMRRDPEFRRREAAMAAEELQLMRASRVAYQQFGTVTPKLPTSVLDPPVLSWTLPEGADLKALKQVYQVQLSARNGRFLQTITIEGKNGRPHFHSVVERVRSESNREIVRELDSIDAPGFAIHIVK